MDRRQEKQEQVQRHLQGAKRDKSLSERKALDKLSRERKASRQNEHTSRRSEWSEEDVAEDFERAERLTSHSSKERQRAPAKSNLVATHPGVVVGLTSGRARVRVATGDVDAGLAPDLARTQQASVAVGDEVGLALRVDGSFLLVEVKERTSTLSRPDPSRPDIERVLAANIDCAVIVVAVREPALRHRLIDRYLIAVERGGIEPIVCANKIDLVENDEARAELDRILNDYRAIGVRTIFTSATTGEGLAELRAELVNQTVVFVGQSGVGKSSLVNAVAPDLGLVVGRVRDGDGKGRHTTTGSTMFDVPLPGGSARLVDTPGVRGFQLAGVSRSSLGEYFRDFSELIPLCRFNDCLHQSEPGCAIQRALDNGELHAARYDTYQRILESLDS